MSSNLSPTPYTLNHILNRSTQTLHPIPYTLNLLLVKRLLLILTTIIQMAAYGQKEGFINNGDSKIYYRTFGEGKPLLIINGGPGMNSDGFVSLAKSLSKNNQTIIYDQRGTGRSTLKRTDSSTITMKAMVEDLETLRKYLQINKWIVLGHSFGGMLASFYATLYPGNIDALILSSSGGIDLELRSYVTSNINARLTQAQRDSMGYWAEKIRAGDTSYYARLQRARALAPAYLYDKKNVPVIAERLTQSNLQLNALVWQDLQKIKFNCAGKLSSFNKPVLIIQGKQDIVEEKTAIKEHAAFPNSRIVIMDHCVHYGWLDRPDEYFSEIAKFVRSIQEHG
jgi:proline iminopeptidase